jgi:hypothetical protein
VAAAEQDLRTLLDGLAPPDAPLNSASLADQLKGLQDQLKGRLGNLARRRRDLNAAAGRLADAVGDATSQRQTFEATASSARQAMGAWSTVLASCCVTCSM